LLPLLSSDGQPSTDACAVARPVGMRGMAQSMYGSRRMRFLPAISMAELGKEAQGEPMGS